MTSAQLWAALSAAGSVTALVVNVVAAIRLHKIGIRKWHIRMWVATLCLFYAAAWGLVVFYEGLDRAAWSRAVTPISALTFFTVWMVDAALDIAETKAIRRTVLTNGDA